MGLVRGIDVTLSVEYPSTRVIGCARAINFEMQRDMVETSIVGSGNFRTFVPGASSFSGSIEGLVFLVEGATSTYGIGYLYDQFLSGDVLAVRYMEQDNNGNYLLKECNIYIDSISESASYDNMVTFSATFKGTGEPTITHGTL